MTLATSCGQRNRIGPTQVEGVLHAQRVVLGVPRRGLPRADRAPAERQRVLPIDVDHEQPAGWRAADRATVTIEGMGHVDAIKNMGATTSRLLGLGADQVGGVRPHPGVQGGHQKPHRILLKLELECRGQILAGDGLVPDVLVQGFEGSSIPPARPPKGLVTIVDHVIENTSSFRECRG